LFIAVSKLFFEKGKHVKSANGKTIGPKLRRKIKAQWAKLTDRDIDDIGASATALSSKIQGIYGRDKRSVDAEVSEFRRLLIVERAHALSASKN
jgi:uncharacterized protein YjbJ (UPF0337 family)